MENNLSTAKQKNLTTNQPKFAVFMNGTGVKSMIENACGKNAQSFTASVISAVTTNPALQGCDQRTILSAALLGESLKLSPSPQLGQYYFVPFEDKNRGLVAQFVLGYKGYIQLALRSGYYRKINVLAIKSGELIKYDPLNEELFVNLIQDEVEREKAKTIGYYAMFEYLNGFRKAIYWSKEKMISHADRYSPAFSKDACVLKKSGKKKVSFADYEAGKFDEADAWLYSSFWYKDFDGMAIKTMLRQIISHWGVMSVEMVKAFVNDERIIESVEGDVVLADEPTEETPQIASKTDETKVDKETGEIINNEPKEAKKEAETTDNENASEDDDFSEDEFFKKK